MPMNHTLKENLVAYVRSGRYRVCQYHLAKEGFGRIREYTPWAILVELAEVEHEWRECGLPSHQPHKAMYVTEGSFEGDSRLQLLSLFGFTEEQTDLLRFRTVPDSVLDGLGITRVQFETLREMADGGYDGSNRIYPATMNQMAEWLYRNIPTDEPEHPENEVGPSKEWADQQNAAGSGNMNAARRNRGTGDISDNLIKHFSELPGNQGTDTLEEAVIIHED